MLANILNTTMPGIIDDSFQTQESVIYDYQNIQEQNNTFAKEIHNLTALNLKQEQDLQRKDEEIQRLLDELSQITFVKENLIPNLTIHDNVTCDVCQATPIVGVRFVCQLCNYNLCEGCEVESNH